MQELYTMSEALKLLGINYTNLRRHIREGRIKYLRKGNLLLIPAEEINRLLRIKKSWLTAKEVMNTLNISKQTLYTWIKKGKLHPIRVGRKSYFSPKEVEAIRKKKAGKV